MCVRPHTKHVSYMHASARITHLPTSLVSTACHTQRPNQQGHTLASALPMEASSIPACRRGRSTRPVPASSQCPGPRRAALCGGSSELTGWGRAGPGASPGAAWPPLRMVGTALL